MQTILLDVIMDRMKIVFPTKPSLPKTMMVILCGVVNNLGIDKISQVSGTKRAKKWSLKLGIMRDLEPVTSMALDRLDPPQTVVIPNVGS